MGNRHLEKQHLALHVIKEVQIKSSEILCSRMQDQAISHCLMLLCHGKELLLSFSSCYLLLKNAGPSHITSFDVALSIVMDRSSYYLLVFAVAALLLQCELGSYDRWHLPGCTIMNNNTRTYKNSFLILPISFINFLHQVQSSPTSWQHFGHMDEVTCGGNAMKFYAV